MPSNTWCSGWGEDFQTRKGPDYPQTKKKEASLSALYACVGIELYHAAKPIRNIGSKLRTPRLPFELPEGCAIPPVLIQVIQLPTHKNNRPHFLKKSKAGDGDTNNAVIYYVMKQATADMINGAAPPHPSIRLLEYYFTMAPRVVENGANKKGDERGRYKLIAVLDTMPRIIESFNATPALITDDGRLFVNTNNITMDININDWVLLVRQSLYNFGGLDSMEGGTMAGARIKIATLIEPRENEHYDERIFGVIQLSQIQYKANAVDWKGELGWKGKMSWQHYDKDGNKLPGAPCVQPGQDTTGARESVSRA